MIVKIKTTKLDDERVVDSWVYFDGFRKVKTIIFKEERFMSMQLRDSINYVAIKEKIIGNPEKEIIPDSGVMIICTKKDGTGEYIIATNQLTYLLNDDGKTIERLM